MIQEFQSYTTFDIHNIFIGNVNEKIVSFRDLPVGWDYGVGIPATNETIELAKYIADMGKAKNFMVDAFPATDGGIVLNLYVEDNFIYTTVHPNGTLDLRYEKGIGENYDILEDIENISLEDIAAHLNTLFNKCFLFEPYTLESTIQTPKDSQVTALKTYKGESPFLTRSVVSQRAVQYVTTYRYSINPQLETQHYIAK